MAAPKVKPIGSLASALVEVSSDGTRMHIGSKANPATRDTIDLVAFNELHSGGCAAVWCSNHPDPALLCDRPTDKGHSSRHSGAHAVPKTFRMTGRRALLAASSTE